jgi:NAD(P)-dependent dehydrogenase (short-subunit alcohol dehydrogenase family)
VVVVWTTTIQQTRTPDEISTASQKLRSGQAPVNVRDAVVVVTGGASGIGRALAQRFTVEGVEAVILVDRDPRVHDVAAAIGGRAFTADVGEASDVERVVADILTTHGRIDLFCSNAGIGGGHGGIDTADEDWQRIWQVNVMAHVYAARAVLPSMLAAGHGYLLQTASAAGLLTQIGSAPYAVTKHAAVAFAEWLAVTYGDRGIKVSCLCPQGVRTPMLAGASGAVREMLDTNALEPEAVADAVVQGLTDERFLILPHPEVAEYYRRKATDPERWLRGMRRLQREVLP